MIAKRGLLSLLGLGITCALGAGLLGGCAASSTTPCPPSAASSPTPAPVPGSAGQSARRAATANETGRPRIVDLTHRMHDQMAFWPGGVAFKKTRLVDYDQGYRLHKFEMGENTGTHVDAPSHFIEGRRSIHELPVEQLVVPAVVIDVKQQVMKNADYELSPADVEAWEQKHGRIPAGVLVLLNTGWHARFSEPEKYINMDATKVMHFPGYGADAASVLVERDVAGIGIDTLSIDAGPSKDFAAHKVMLGANKYQIENLANLDALPPSGATVVVGVLPVGDGSQAQARVLALLPVLRAPLAPAARPER